VRIHDDVISLDRLPEVRQPCESHVCTAPASCCRRPPLVTLLLSFGG
jgi:hypothetical protein